MERAIALVGIALLVGIGLLASTNRRAIRWRSVGIAIGLQVVVAFLALKTAPGAWFFEAANVLAVRFIGAADQGINFVFGEWPAEVMGAEGSPVRLPYVFAVRVLPIIVFMSGIFSVLYHFGVLQRAVSGLSRGFRWLLPISGAESLATIANVFLGMTEAPLMVRPYVAGMTRSELFCVMSAGLATVAGSILIAYIGMIGADLAGHLIAASFMSAPAAIAFAKLIVPEEGKPLTLDGATLRIPRQSVNALDALAIGASDGLRLALNVGAMLVVFVAVIYLLDGLLGWGGQALLGIDDLSFGSLLGYLLSPLAWLLGVPWSDAPTVAEMLGVKTVLNEFIAYQQLADVRATLDPRSVVISSYALCGFANFGSLGILLGGLGGIAPERRPDIARDGLRAILAGSLATFANGAIAGMLV
jgi:CNT family concentrative nucleoside transporter